jgi:hypothetical protein
MLLLTHILIACASILQSTYSMFKTSGLQIKISYTLFGLTVATGSVLMVLNPKSLTQTCYTGLVYLVIAGTEIFIARRKLSKVINT